MKHNDTTRSTESPLQALTCDVQKITAILVALAQNDWAWWTEHLSSLTKQPLKSLHYHLSALNNATLAEFDTEDLTEPEASLLEPLEALVWLTALCQFDRILIGVLPRKFVELIDLQWQIFAVELLR